MENEIERKDEIYEKPDSDKGYVEGEHDVLQMRVLRYKDVILNNLLGDFDENGKYVIADDILKDLVTLTKKIDAHTQNGTEGRAFVGDRVLYFNLTPPVSLGNGQAYCYLQLLEEIPRIGGYYIDTHTTIVATYEYKDDEFFADRALEVFNFKEYKADETIPPELLPDSLAQRFAYVDAMLKEAGDPLDKLEEAYFNKRLQVLSEYPELAVILAEFTAKRNKLEPYFIKNDHKYFYLNQILDDILSSEQYKKIIEASPAQFVLKEAENKYFDLSIKVEQKVRTDSRVNEKKQEAIFANITENGKASAPAQKKLPANVKTGATKYPGQDLKYKPDKFKGGGGKGGGGKKPDKPKAKEDAGHIYQPDNSDYISWEIKANTQTPQNTKPAEMGNTK